MKSHRLNADKQPHSRKDLLSPIMWTHPVFGQFLFFVSLLHINKNWIQMRNSSFVVIFFYGGDFTMTHTHIFHCSTILKQRSAQLWSIVFHNVKPMTHWFAHFLFLFERYSHDTACKMVNRIRIRTYKIRTSFYFKLQFYECALIWIFVVMICVGCQLYWWAATAHLRTRSRGRPIPVILCSDFNQIYRFYVCNTICFVPFIFVVVGSKLETSHSLRILFRTCKLRFVQSVLGLINQMPV